MKTKVKVHILVNASFAIPLLALLKFQPNCIHVCMLSQGHNQRAKLVPSKSGYYSYIYTV